MVECICDYAEAKLFSITKGINKEQKHIIQNIEQQKMRTIAKYGAITGEGYKLSYPWFA